METHIRLPIKEPEKVSDENEEIRHRAERIWNSIVKHITDRVTIHKDGIFIDPDWPHLWDHKR